MHSYAKALQKLIILLSSLVFLVACGGTRAAADASWTIVELLTKGEDTKTELDIVEVRNCGIAEKKTYSCNAGTSNDFSAGFSGDVGLSLGVDITLASSVASELGFYREGGESLQLSTPPDNNIFRYVIIKEFSITSGNALAQSSDGKNREVEYSYSADCSLRIYSKEQFSCDEADEFTQDLVVVPTQGLAPKIVTATPPSIVVTSTSIPISNPTYTTTPVPYIDNSQPFCAIVKDGVETMVYISYCILSPNYERVVGLASSSQIVIYDVDGTNKYSIEFEKRNCDRCYGSIDFSNLNWVDDHQFRLGIKVPEYEEYTFLANEFEIGKRGEFIFVLGELNVLEEVIRDK